MRLHDREALVPADQVIGSDGEAMGIGMGSITRTHMFFMGFWMSPKSRSVLNLAPAAATQPEPMWPNVGVPARARVNAAR